MARSPHNHRPARARARAFSIGTAVAVHLAIATGLILAIQIPHMVEPPAIQVRLVPPFRIRAPAPAKPPPARPRQERPIAPRAARQVGPEVVAPLSIPAAPPDTVTRERLLAAPFAPHDHVREGLRTSGGCTDADWLKLSPAEREACRKRNHDLGTGAPTYAVGPSDPVHRAFLDKQAAKNEKRWRELEAPPTHPLVPCTGRMSNLGFSCTP
ncbi:MAG: hypothetical protein P4L73_01565 [Caulobacteraceae bacterium]|nr:hypothetical protein [Caulobacteraceae bacterium]